MSSDAEVSILQQCIAEFHAEKAHSRVRKEILQKTVNLLQNVTTENDDYWTQKRVRTWFWNHRDEVPQYSGKRKLDTDENSVPPKKRKLQTKSPKKKENKLEEEPNYTSMDDGYDTEADSDVEKHNSTGNNIRMINLAPTSVESALQMLKPKSESAISFITSSIRLFRIFACRAVGPDKAPTERWMTKTIGNLCFLTDYSKGRIRWKHDRETVAFCGSLSFAGHAFATEHSRKYSMFGKAGTEIMKERCCWSKDVFSCFFRVTSSPEAAILNNDSNIRREQDILAFGRDEYNSIQAKTELTLLGGDIVGELEFGSLAGKLCGMSIYARPIDCDKWFPELSQTEHSLILHTLQDSLLAQQKPKPPPPQLPQPPAIPQIQTCK